MNPNDPSQPPSEYSPPDQRDGTRELDTPAIGAIVTEENSDTCVRVALRAKHRGFPIFVIYSTMPPVEVLSLLTGLGARIVNPGRAERDEETLVRRLSEAATGAGYPGLIFHRRVHHYIDYRRSVSTLESTDADTVEAVTATQDRVPRTIAAIPAFNAGRSIGAVVERTQCYVDEVFVVDDGSNDDTAERASEAGATVLQHARNHGYGAALRTAFQEANRWPIDHLVVLDGDGQHNPDDIPRLLEAREGSGADVVIGSRYALGSNTRIPLLRSVGLGVVNLLTNASLGRFSPRTWVRDTQSGFRAYSRDAVESLASADIGRGMEASTDIIYRLNREGFEFDEVGATISYDVEQASTQGAFAHGAGLVQNIVRFLEQNHPLVILGFPGGVSLLIGIFFGIRSIELLVASQISSVVLLLTALFTSVGTMLLILALFLHAINIHPYFRMAPK